MKEDGSYKVLLRDGSVQKNGHGSVYVKIVNEYLLKHIETFEKEDIVFRPDHLKAM